jgi:hypothetical protein
MNGIKKGLGVVWILLGLYAAYDRIVDSLQKIGSGVQADVIFGWIILLVLTPIITGSLVLFGMYCLQNEYAD